MPSVLIIAARPVTLRSSVGGEEEGGEVERWRARRFNSVLGSARAGISEPELDMRRTPMRRGGRIAGLFAAWRWLVPGRSGLGPPTRSIDRELEESWPSWHR